MSLYRVTADKLESVPRTTFAAASLMERKDLQRFLHRDVTPLGDDLMVIAEEYGDWEDSNRRIDLLCLNTDADLVVVEIKRTEDGGHMELQAIRYAAMVSSMTLEKVIQAYARTRSCDEESARTDVVEFLKPNAADEVALSGDVKIILVSADFSTEVTTAVMWLNRKGLDITCIRLRPYRMGTEILIDATQIIPLPEAADYEVKMREQEQEKKKVLSARHEIFRKFWAQTIDRSKSQTPLLANRTTTGDHWLSAGIGRGGFTLNLILNQQRGMVECYIRLSAGDEKTTAAFHALHTRKDEIQKDFGGELDWQELPGRHGCRICVELPDGWKAPESAWPGMQERMIATLIKFEKALKQPIQQLNI